MNLGVASKHFAWSQGGPAGQRVALFPGLKEGKGAAWNVDFGCEQSLRRFGFRLDNHGPGHLRLTGTIVRQFCGGLRFGFFRDLNVILHGLRSAVFGHAGGYPFMLNHARFAFDGGNAIYYGYRKVVRIYL